MRKTTKIWLIAATALLLLGAALFGGVMSFWKWDFTKLDTRKYQTNTHDITEEFDSISVLVKEADVAFLPSDGDTCRVVCCETEKMKHTVEVADGTLTVRVEDTRKWYHYVGIHFRHPLVTVYLPQGEYGALTVKGSTGDVGIPKELGFTSIDVKVSTGDVKNYASATGGIRIDTSTGDILTEGNSCGALSLSVSTGDVTVSGVTCEGDVTVGVSTGKTYLTNMTCKSVISSGNTGDISLKNVIATEKFSIKRSTGDVTFDGCDAAEIFVETDTGDVEGSLLTDKEFIARTDTGKIDVPKTVAGGRCEITTDTGRIKINIFAQ
ncbi:MAG: DUF4097 domain-containing protein [Ruminococcaceae bacterium]|nr:DUF4097 domain-containing protein [Oscillospiraceae bacterium]